MPKTTRRRHSGFDAKSAEQKLYGLYLLARQISPNDVDQARELYGEGVAGMAKSGRTTRDVIGQVICPDIGKVVGDEQLQTSAEKYFNRLATSPPSKRWLSIIPPKFPLVRGLGERLQLH